MINPYDITNFNRSKSELQELLLFCIIVAGKTAYIQANKLEEFLKSSKVILNLEDFVSPFHVLRLLNRCNILMDQIMKAKLGQYNKIYSAFKYLCENDLDLYDCSAHELEKIPGIGMKTSRFFIMHSRNVRDVAVLDVHILKFLSSLGHKVPKATPNKNQYLQLEKIFLDYCTENEIHPAHADLNIWKSYAKKQNRVVENV